MNITKILDEVHLLESESSKETAKKVDWWRSSSLGSCLRGQFLARLLSGDFKVQHDRRTMDVFELGNITEDIKIEKLKKHPDYLVITQGEMHSQMFNIKGHFDALIIDLKTNEAFMGEFKSKNSRAFTYMDKKKEGAMAHHKLQNHSYQFMCNNDGFALSDSDSVSQDPYMIKVRSWLMGNAKLIRYVNTNGENSKPVWRLNNPIKEGSIFYVSKDDQRTLEYPVMYNDLNLLGEWQRELNILNKAWENQDVLPPNAPGAWQSKYCQYCQAGLCEKLDTKEVVQALFKTVQEADVARQSEPF